MVDDKNIVLMLTFIVKGNIGVARLVVGMYTVNSKKNHKLKRIEKNT